jgi:O-antigen ligase
MSAVETGGRGRHWRSRSTVRLAAPTVAIVLAFYVLRPHVIWPGLAPLHPVVFAVGLAVLSVFVEIACGARFPRSQVSLWFVTALGVWALAGVPWAVDGALARSHAEALLKIALVFAVLRHALRDRRGFLLVTWTVVACTSILSVAALDIYLFATFKGSRFLLLSGPNANTNDLSIMLASALPFALAFTTGARHRWSRRAALAAAVIVLAGISAAQSKGASLATLGVVVAYAWRHRLHGALWLAAAVGLHLGVPAVAELTSPMTVRHQAMHYVGGKATVDRSSPRVLHRAELVLDLKQRSYVARLAIWRVGLKLIRDHPLHGVGAGCFITAYTAAVDPSYPEDLRTRSAHNSFVEVAAELGLPGAVLFLGVLAGPLVAWRRSSRQGERRGDGLGAAAASCALVAVWGACYLDHLENWMLYFAVAAAESAAWAPWLGGGVKAASAGASDDDALDPV